MTYSQFELDNAALADLLADARRAMDQAVTGPFYPERGITADSLRDYARKCRRQAAHYAKGGAHVAVMAGI